MTIFLNEYTITLQVDVGSPSIIIPCDVSIRLLRHLGFNEPVIHDVPAPVPGFPQLNSPFSSSVVQVFCVSTLINEAALDPHWQRFDASTQRGAWAGHSPVAQSLHAKSFPVDVEALHTSPELQNALVLLPGTTHPQISLEEAAELVPVVTHLLENSVGQTIDIIGLPVVTHWNEKIKAFYGERNILILKILFSMNNWFFNCV